MTHAFKGLVFAIAVVFAGACVWSVFYCVHMLFGWWGLAAFTALVVLGTSISVSVSIEDSRSVPR